MNNFLLKIGISVAFFSFINPVIADVELGDGTILSDQPTYVVTYVEVSLSASDEAAKLIKDHVENGLTKEGNLRFEAVQRLGRDNHFVILEAWSSPIARLAHAESDSTVTFRHSLEPLLYAPYDERPHVGLEASDVESLPAGDENTIYVVTHADIVPPEQFAPCGRAANPEGPCGNDMLIDVAQKSRSHEGNMRFDVLTQNNRANHMTVVEMWQDSQSQAAHQIHQEKRDFRDLLAGIKAGSGVNPDPHFVPNMLTGSLWDERLYRLID